MEWSEPLFGLAEVPDDATEVILMSDWPILDCVRLTSAVRLVKRLIHSDCPVGIATPHPTSDWLKEAFLAGAEYLVVTPPGPSKRWKNDVLAEHHHLEECCPGLHQRVRHNQPMSVCGCHDDRMVLSDHHFSRWCVGNFSSCPYWSAQNVAKT